MPAELRKSNRLLDHLGALAKVTVIARLRGEVVCLPRRLLEGARIPRELEALLEIGHAAGIARAPAAEADVVQCEVAHFFELELLGEAERFSCEFQRRHVILSLERAQTRNVQHDVCARTRI